MFYEDVKVQHRETVSRIALDYGYKATDWTIIWNDAKNRGVATSRTTPNKLQVGDVLHLPIPWRVISKVLTKQPDGGQIVIKRDGELGKRLTWVQTVYRHNQPIGPNPNPFCVDGCTPDDNLPFYWTNAEIAADPTLRKTFSDHSSRIPPSAAKGTTKWRAIVSLAAVTKKRVTVWNSLVWGWDMTPAGVVSTVGPRAATAHESIGHLNLLRNGQGTGPLTFSGTGWTFRSPPP